ncbi:MAG: glycosyltransferase family 9 protein [Rhodocyclaceae bacterium]|nr:glycosyltransferase family 9 protein [Rhodocyclaceae bacterium]
MLSIDRMRWLDRWVGVPLCGLASVLRRMRPGARQLAPARRVAFLQLAESGSNVLADPAVRRWMAQAPHPPAFVTFAKNRASLRLTGSIADEDVFPIDPGSLATLLRDVWRLRRWLRSRGVDTLVDLELFTRVSALIGLFCGTARRVGFHAPDHAGLYRGDLYTDPVPFAFNEHISRNYLALVAALDGAPVPPGLPAVARRPLQPDERQRVTATLAQLFPQGCGALVLINANASDMLPQRRWPAERFEALAHALLAHDPALSLLLTGGSEDRATTAALAAQIDDPRCVDGAGRFTLGELPALFERAALLVTNDSGPAHFASVSPVHVIVLFGPETPLRFGPLGESSVFYAGLPCSPCVTPANQRRSACTDNRCLQAISVEAVLARAKAVLADTLPAAGEQRLAG